MHSASARNGDAWTNYDVDGNYIGRTSYVVRHGIIRILICVQF